MIDGQATTDDRLIAEARMGDVETVKDLIEEYGSDVYKGWADNCGLLCDSLTFGNVEVAKYLLATDLKVNERNAGFDCYPLHLAIKLKDEHVIKMLLEKYTDVNVVNREKYTPLYEAVSHDNVGIAGLLLNSGSDVNSINRNNRTPLHMACKNGNAEIVNLLLQNGANVNARTNGFRTPLHVAAEKGHLEVMKLLIFRGALVNARTVNATTPLHVAIETDSKDVVKCILDSGADANAKTSKDVFPLYLAVKKKNKQMVELLLSNGALVNPETCSITPLCAAVKTGRKDIVELLLTYGACVNNLSRLRTNSDVKETPLHIAAGIGNKDIVELLLSHGAKIDNVNARFGSPLHYAIIYGKKDIVHFLLKSNAQVNLAFETKTPMHVAVKKGDTEIVELLLRNGAIANSINNRTMYDEILTLTLEMGHVDIVDLFLRSGAEVNTKIQKPGTGKCSLGIPCDWDFALHIAAKNGSTSVVKLLLDRGANVNAVTEFGSALHVAAETGREEIVKILLEFGASVNAQISMKDWSSPGKGKTGIFHTPLYKAAENGHKDVVVLLLSHGASVDATNGYAPIEIAAVSGNWEIVKILLNCSVSVGMVDSLSGVLNSAIAYGNRTITELLLSNGANVNLKPDCLIPFLNSFKKASQDPVGMCLRSGASINDMDMEEDNADSFAAKSDMEFVKLLLDRGALINASNYKCTVLSSAVKSGNKEIVELLLDKGADVNSHSDVDLPLQEAVKGGWRDIVEMLLKKGAEVNAVDSQDTTALCFACKSSNKDIVELLLNYGANANTRNKYGHTPLCVAASLGNTDIVKLLLINNARANGKSFDKATSEFGFDRLVTPLFVAISGGHVEITDLLLMNGADLLKLKVELCSVRAPDYSDWGTDSSDHCTWDIDSALSLAVENNNAELVKVILKYYADPIHRDIQIAYHSAWSSWGPNSFKVIDAFFEHGYTVKSTEANDPSNLFTAVANGHLRAVEQILKLCTDVQQILYSKNGGFTPLQVASIYKRRDIAQILITNGADVNAANEYEKTPIVHAIEGSDFDMFTILIPYVDNKQDLLFNAVSSKDLRIVTNLLKHDVDVNKCDKNGKSALHLTLLPFKNPEKVNKGTPEILKEIVSLLLKNGANVDVSTTDGETPLHYAAQYGSLEIVALLVEKNAKVNVVDRNGFTPLHHSVRSTNVKITKLLLDESADVNSTTREGVTPLHFACESGYAELVALLLESASLKDCQLIVNARTKIGYTPLHCVARNYVDVQINRPAVVVSYDIDFYEVTNILFRKGAEVNAVAESQSSTPLHVAVQRQQWSLVNLLLRNGANVNAKHEHDYTSLHVACKLGNVAIVRLLLNHSADINAKDAHGITPIYFVNGYLTSFNLLKLLLDFGARLDCVSKSVLTKHNLIHPLRLAVESGNKKCVDLLLNGSCHVNTKFNEGETSLHVACKLRNADIVNVLLNYFADVNAKDNKGNTPLYSICALSPQEPIRTECYRMLVWSLLDHGAELNTICENGTALHVTAINNKVQLIKILVEFGADINTTNVRGISPLESAKADSQSIRSLVHSSKIDSPECFFYLLIHCIKMKAANLYVSERNLHYLKPEVFKQFYIRVAIFYPRFPKLLIECEREISTMKLMKISDSEFTIFDVVTGNMRKLFKISTYNLSSILESEYFKSNVTLYADIITSNFERAKKRRELEEKCGELGLFRSLPDLCKEHIFSYVTNADLRMLMNAYGVLLK